MIARSRTKAVSIDRPVAEVFDFLADPANWSKWAVVNIKSIEPTEDPDWWAMSTRVGPARLRLRADAEFGILDHDYLDDTATWRVRPRRRHGDGAEFLITFYQPPGFSDQFFDEQIALVDTELSTLKSLLETQE